MTRSLFFSLLLLSVLIGGIVTMVARRYMGPAAVVLDIEDQAEQEELADDEPTAWQIEDFALTDSDGIEFDSLDLRGQVWVASFFFSSCPSICRQQNEIVRSLCRQYRQEDVKFVSITCDPETDTVERLHEYGKVFEADPEDWFFLTGEMEKITKISETGFHLGVGKQTHADRLVVVDRWGWVRGSYDWHDNRQVEALHQQLENLTQEDSSPYITTQNKSAVMDNGAWIHDFTLIDSEGEPFDSRNLQGDVWVASFFFTTCASVCRDQNNLVSRLYRQFGRQGVRFVCISCDPETDTPERLQDYARLYDANPERWHFLTGDLTYIRRIGAERFDILVDRRAHADRLIVVDRNGEVRGKFNWHEAAEVERTEELLEQLLQEPKPANDSTNNPEESK